MLFNIYSMKSVFFLVLFLISISSWAESRTLILVDNETCEISPNDVFLDIEDNPNFKKIVEIEGSIFYKILKKNPQKKYVSIDFYNLKREDMEFIAVQILDYENLGSFINDMEILRDANEDLLNDYSIKNDKNEAAFLKELQRVKFDYIENYYSGCIAFCNGREETCHETIDALPSVGWFGAAVDVMLHAICHATGITCRADCSADEIPDIDN